MLCPKCRFDNRANVSFCEECGASLDIACSSCGAAVPAGRKFCGGCGKALGGATAPTSRFASPETYTPKHLAERILTSKAALEGERKQVTVLFADLKGSMELLADRDPEEARKLLDPVLEHMMEAVHRYEGTVNQVMGDGIMALFGAPLAHEDHAVRACYAALRMQESAKRYAEGVRREHGVTVRIRVGLNSGEVVVRTIGSDLHMDYTAVGQTTHLAARMEQLAEPGSILLSPATMELAEGYVEVKPLGPLPVKGLPAPLEVYELVGAGAVRSRLHAAAARGLTRFVGRDSEVDQLRQALERAQAGHGQVVAVVGEPGVGKSRLYWEFTHSHRAQGWLMLESGSVSYGKATAYLPVIDLLKAYFHIEGRDDTRTIREKVTGKVLSLDRALEPSLSALLSLLEVPVEDDAWGRLDPPQRRQRTLDAVKRLLLRESQVQPLMLLVEDLHWIDAETQALLDSLVESLPTARLLLLANYRPEYQHRWGSKTYYRQLRIDPLPRESADDLLTSLLGTEQNLDPLKRTLIERTEGNPLFLEESVRTLAETKALVGERGAYRLAHDATAIQVPATVQAILAARIDRLPPEDKRLLQAASVIGKDVPFTLLLAIAELAEDDLRRGLAHLQAAELLYETSLFPDLAYTFKHALTHEVTYGGLLQERRRDLHARIVDVIETLHQDRLGEHIERLAHHAQRGDLGEKAVHYLRQAGLKATARSAPGDAEFAFERALAVLDKLPETRTKLEAACDIRFELGAVIAPLGKIGRMLELLGEAKQSAETLNDELRSGHAWSFMMRIHAQRMDLDDALVAGTRALEIADRCGNLDLRFAAISTLESVHFHRGEFERVVQLATGNLTAVPSNYISQYAGGGAPIHSTDRFWLVRSLTELGRLDEAAREQSGALRVAESTGQLWLVGQTLQAAVLLHLLRGDWEEARRLSEQRLSVVRTGNIAPSLCYALAMSAQALAQMGHVADAAKRVSEGERVLEDLIVRGALQPLRLSYYLLGRSCFLLERLDEARSFADRALALAPFNAFLPYALHLLGELASHPQQWDPDRGIGRYEEALGIAAARGMRPLVAHCHLGLGKLYHRTGKRQQAQEHLTTSTTMYREMDMTYWLEQAAAELKELA